MESKVPQLSMFFVTSDENTPSNIIQVDEYISLNISVTLPEVGYSPSFNSSVTCVLYAMHFRE